MSAQPPDSATMVKAMTKPTALKPDQTNGASNGHADKEQPALLKSGFARQTRKYIQLMDELRACGTSVDNDVPTIAILGNQSSGKSSVIEGISGISLPRASGTCTRCPTEVRLIRKDCAWHCKISLRFEKDADGNAKDKVQEIPFGEDIHEPAAVTERLRRAQIAILSGDIDHRVMLTANIEDLAKPSTSFSENTICITIYGPDCVNLSFIDLPGIIVYAGHGDDSSDVQTVERMARNAVSRENCIILLTITCTDDIQNQSGATLARQVDPEGKRTIGVLTKPDRIAEADHREWLKILLGKAHPLRLGYYAVKNPGTKELEQGLTNAEARKQEAAFFAEEPWASLSVKSRCGTAGLAQRLSGLLEHTIAAKLPELASTIHGKLLQSKKEIDRLPAAISEKDAAFHVMSLCQSLGSELASTLGEDPHLPDFNRDLRDTAFVPFATHVLDSAPVFFAVVEDNRQITVKDLSLYAVRSARDQGSVIFRKDELAEEYFGERQRVVYGLDVIRQKKLRATTYELPGNLPYHVKAQLIKETFQHWPHLAQKCFDLCRDRLQALLKGMVNKHFGMHTQGGLHSKAHQIAADLQIQCESRFQEHLRQLLEPELNFIYTHCSQDFATLREANLSELKSRRPGNCSMDNLTQEQKTIMQDASQRLKKVPGFGDVKAVALTKALPPDEYEQELAICAEVGAYFSIAAKRIIDIVPMAIVAHYVGAVGGSLQTALLKELGVNDEGATERCYALVAEDPELSEKRAELQAQKQRLTEGLAAVRNFGLT